MRTRLDVGPPMVAAINDRRLNLINRKSSCLSAFISKAKWHKFPF
jgi:hypothetical protein